MMGQQMRIGPQMGMGHQVRSSSRWNDRTADENWAPDGYGTSGELQQQMGMMGQQMIIGPQMGMGHQVSSSRWE
jgi:hypothetical protein